MNRYGSEFQALMALALLRKSGYVRSSPFPLTDLSRAQREGRSKGGEAVQDGRPDLKLGHLSVEVARHDALSQEFEAAHLGLDQASSVIASPAFPDSPAKTAATAQGVVARDRPCRVFLPRLAVPAGRDDRRCPARRDGGVTGPRIIGPIGGDHAQGLIARDLVQQVGHNWRIADPAARDLDGPDFQRLSINPDVDLAPVSRLRRAVSLGQPLAIALDLHASAVGQQVQSA